MKCLVLLVAVVVCQGAILRQRPVLDVPEVFKPQLQKNDPLRFKEILDLKKLARFNQNSWTTNDLYSSFQNFPWDNEMTFLPKTTINPNLDYENFRDLLKFPGSEFLDEEIEKYLNGLTTNIVSMDTEDYDILPTTMEKLQQTLPQYMQMFRDPKTMAQVVTRDVVKIVLNGRMHCATSIWDVNFIKRVQNQLIRTLYKKQRVLTENLATMLPQVMPLEPEMIEQLVYGLTSDLQQHLYKDIVQYVHGVGFKDVAILGHKLYYDLKQTLEEYKTQDPDMLMQKIVSIVNDVVTKRVTCPRPEEISKITEQACWDFNMLFVEREVARLHSRLETILRKILNKVCYGEKCQQYLDAPTFYPNTQIDSGTYPTNQFVPNQMYSTRYDTRQHFYYPRMTKVVKMIKLYVQTVVQGVSVCQAPICWDPTTCNIDQDLGLGTNEVNYRRTLLQQEQTPFWMNTFQGRGY